MNKRITSLALVFVMVLSLLATAVPVLAAPTDPLVTFTVEADKTSAKPGEEITYTVSMEQKDTLVSFAFNLSIPAGLTYVKGSHKLAEAALEILPPSFTYDETEGDGVTPFYLVYWMDSMAEDFTYTDKFELITFKCKVDEGAAAGTECKLDLSLVDIVGGSTNGYNLVNDQTVVVPAAITVTAAPNPATGITLNKSELTLTAGATETLEATVTPSDTTDTVAWSSNKPEVATVDPTTGMVTAVAPGEAIITAKAGSVSATCTVKVSCAHNLQTVPAKESNCTEKGWDEYQKCTLCGARFNTSADPIEEIPYRPLNDDHDFNMSEWGYQGDDGHAHVCTRNPDHKDGVVPHTSSGSATETEDEVCTVCGYVITPATGHVCASHLTKVEAKPADCTNPGNKEHYKCECGNLYKDADALVPTDLSEVTIAALGHDWKDATCTTPKTCDRCHTIEGEALGHNWATEWSSNETKHWHDCSRCDVKNDEADHTPDRAEATETDPIKCTVCGYVIASATGHVCANHLTKVDRVEADCTTPGNIEHYKCTCNKLYADLTASVPLTEEQVKLNALGHNWADEWKSDATGHWLECTRDPEHHSTKESHNPGPAATEDTPQTCTDCGYVIDPATGHLCINHLVEVPEVPATCTTTGTEAHFKCTDPACGKLYWDDDAYDLIEDPSELVIDALDHAWADEWSSDATNHWHACTRCDAKTDEAAHTPDHPDGATFEYPVLCVECHYEMEAQLENVINPGDNIGAMLPYITTESIANGEKGSPYDTVFEADGYPDMHWEVSKGALPEGLTLSVDGRLSGTPEEGGEFKFTVRVTNSFGYDTKTFTLTVSDNGEDIEIEEPIENKPDEEEEVNVDDETSEQPVEENPQTGAAIALFPVVAVWIVLLLISDSTARITFISKKEK